MKKHGFTLMELLLSVAILAIIAVAVAPAWNEGSQQALDESKKGAFCSAFQNTVSGANLMMGVMLTRYGKTSDKGSGYKNEFLPTGLSLDAQKQFTYKENKKDIIKNLNYYAPVSNRRFKNLKDKEFFISAKIGDNQTVVLYYVESNGYVQNSSWGKSYTDTAYSQATKTEQEIHITQDHTLDDVWEELKNKEY